MRKSLWIFFLAIFIPSAVLGWLALRSAEAQKLILEQRTAELYQRETEGLAGAARTVIDDQRRAFSDTVRQLLATKPADQLASEFTKQLSEAWGRKAIGFSITEDGIFCSPTSRTAKDSAELQKFLVENGPFLSNKSVASVYTVPVDEVTQPEVVRKLKSAAGDLDVGNRYGQANTRSQYAQKQIRTAPAPKTQQQEVLEPPKAEPPPAPAPAALPAEKSSDTQIPADRMSAPIAPAGAPKSRAAPTATGHSKPAPATMAQDRAKEKADAEQAFKQSRERVLQEPKQIVEQKAAAASLQSAVAGADAELQAQQPLEGELNRRSDWVLRNVQPQQQMAVPDRAAWSALAPATAEFRQLAEESAEGILSRFVQDKLTLIFWLRPPQAPKFIFGCVVDVDNLRDLWPAAMPTPGANEKGEFVVALLDDKTKPVAYAPADAGTRDWKRPFVASEIGEVLPHWEAALYLKRPEQLRDSALSLRRTLTFLVVGMLGAIVLGGWLVVADARRQLALAQQKTDFVSNVSHELKTPLTSIRMFAELMLGGRAETQAKSPQYLRIIMVEAERLTRLINNVLDFAKLERKQKRFDKKPLDLHAVIDRTWESQELHLQESGFTTKWQAAAPPYPVIGDDDALAQILVNLLSNAEKYSGERKEVELQTYLDDHHLYIAVLDRGVGVPVGEERKIFEAFYRAHDSLSSGIQGSGLGLTLAQRLALEHGGTIEYRARDGGGSAFTLKLPLARLPDPSFDQALDV